MGIALPIFLTMIASAEAAKFEWSLITSQISSGTFLAPIAILCIDSVIRVTRLPYWASNRIRAFRLITAFFCALTALVCCVGTAAMQAVKLTVQLGHQITVITISCLAASVITSVISVIVKNAVDDE